LGPHPLVLLANRKHLFLSTNQLLIIFIF